jgi:hypothetical protein
MHENAEGGHGREVVLMLLALAFICAAGFRTNERLGRTGTFGDVRHIEVSSTPRTKRSPGRRTVAKTSSNGFKSRL